MAMLSIQDHGRSQVAGSTHDILRMRSLLVRVVGYKLAKDLNVRLGEESTGQQVENTRWEG
jgi:hypothetical protein